MSRVSVIIPNFNGIGHLPECLTTLEAQDFSEPFDIVLADNDSRDGSVDFVRTNHPRAKIVETGSNLGFAGACNAGIRATQGEYIVLLNNDTRLPPSWLRELVSVADASPPDVFAVGSLLLLYHYPDRINSAGGNFSPMGGGFDRMIGQTIGSSHIPATPYVTAISPGAAVLYRRKTYEELGGLDDRFFMYFEDVEICYRAWKKGHQCLMAPQAIAYHKYGGTAGTGDSPIRIYWGQRNRIRMIGRNFGPRLFAKSMLILIAFTAFRIVALSAYRQFDSVKHIVRGSLDGFRDLPALRGQHRRERHAGTRSDHDLARMHFFASVWHVIKEGKRIRRLREAGISV